METSTKFLDALNDRELAFFYTDRLPTLQSEFQSRLRKLTLKRLSKTEINSIIRKPIRPKRNSCERCGSNKLEEDRFNDEVCTVCNTLNKKSHVWRILQFLFSFLLKVPF